VQVRRETIGYLKAAEQRQRMLRSRPRGRTWLQMALFPEQCSQEGFLDARALWMQLEAQVDLPEMGVACEDVGDVKIDAGAYVLVYFSSDQFRAAWRLRQKYQDKPDISFVDFTSDSSQNRVNEPLSLCGRRAS